MRGSLPSAVRRLASRYALMIEPLEERVALSATPASIHAAWAALPTAAIAESTISEVSSSPPATNDSAPVATHPFGSVALTFESFHATDRLPALASVELVRLDSDIAHVQIEASIPQPLSFIDRVPLLKPLAADLHFADVGDSRLPLALLSGNALPEMDFNSNGLQPQTQLALRVDKERLLSLTSSAGPWGLGAETLRVMPQSTLSDISLGFQFKMGMVRPEGGEPREIFAMHRLLGMASDREMFAANLDRPERAPGRLGELVGLAFSTAYDEHASDANLESAMFIGASGHALQASQRGVVATPTTNTYVEHATANLSHVSQTEFESADSMLFPRLDADPNSGAWRARGHSAGQSTTALGGVSWCVNEFQVAFGSVRDAFASVAPHSAVMLLPGFSGNLEAVDEAIASVMQELDRFGGEVGSWLDGLLVEFSLGSAVAIAAIGSGAWYLTRERDLATQQREHEAESSSWLFVRLQSSVG